MEREIPPNVCQNEFLWSQFDIGRHLPPTWAQDIRHVAETHASRKDIKPTSVTSRERDCSISLPTLIVDGNTIKKTLPWLYTCYTDLFLPLAQRISNEPVFAAKNPLYAINLNIQRGTEMRYECHVDSNPIQSVFYATTHLPGTGGELVVSTDIDALGVDEIDENSAILYPIAGNIVFFDGRKYPHYVRPLSDPDEIRISIPMNFYTPSSPEEERPSDLNDHLF